MLDKDLCSLALMHVDGGGGKPEWWGELGLLVAGDWWEVGKGNRPTLRDIDLKFKDLITDTE